MIYFNHGKGRKPKPKEKEETKMMNWYENPELHDADYEELENLLAELAKEDEED